jgi:hypothetical protein
MTKPGQRVLAQGSFPHASGEVVRPGVRLSNGGDIEKKQSGCLSLIPACYSLIVRTTRKRALPLIMWS